jgi:hypothetical protein
MIKTPYNGWSAKIRNVRGNWLSSKKPLALRDRCSLCGGQGGLTVHAEEYGSTLEDFLLSCYELCAHCHGMLHCRFTHPHRFQHFRQQLSAGREQKQFNSLYQFFQAMNAMGDLPDAEGTGQSGVPWLDALTTDCYSGLPKIALIERDGLYLPDPAIYPIDTPVHGLRWNAQSGEMTEYRYGQSC